MNNPATFQQPHDIYQRLINNIPFPEYQIIKENVMAAMDISHQTWYGIVKGKVQRPNAYTIAAIAEEMDCTMKQVLDPHYDFQSDRDRQDKKLASKMKLNAA